jgi:hypothetical protein
VDKLLWAVLLAVVALGGAHVGARYRADEIQATCEDDHGHTVINGAPYVCLSARQLRMLNQAPGRET